MRTTSRLFTAALFCAVATAAPAQDETPEKDRPQPCKAAEYRQFDFWIGAWEVRDPDGEVVGRNTIKPVLGGCALKESWRGVGDSRGYSFNTYDRAAERWHQTWVDANGLLLQLDGGLEDGSMVLRGEMPSPDDGTVLTRIAWTPKDNGHVRQHWESSRDGGETWETVFDGLYVPVERTGATSGE